jgi:hypothetical protein
MMMMIRTVTTGALKTGQKILPFFLFIYLQAANSCPISSAQQ